MESNDLDLRKLVLVLDVMALVGMANARPYKNGQKVAEEKTTGMRRLEKRYTCLISSNGVQ
jgi:hypothetical protein